MLSFRRWSHPSRVGPFVIGQIGAVLRDCVVATRSMQRDEKRKADTKDGQRNEEVAVGEDSFGFLDRCHGTPGNCARSTGATIRSRRDECQDSRAFVVTQCNRVEFMAAAHRRHVESLAGQA